MAHKTTAQGTIIKNINGKDYRFCLSMYGLAEIEEKIGTNSLDDFQSRLMSGSFNVLMDVTLVLMKEAGTEYTREVFKNWSGDIQFMINLIREVFEESGFYKKAPKKTTDASREEGEVDTKGK